MNNIDGEKHWEKPLNPKPEKTGWENVSRFHKSIHGGFDFRCFGGWLVCYNREVFCLWWSNDAAPPTKKDKNGLWIIGSYRKWASSKYA